MSFKQVIARMILIILGSSIVYFGAYIMYQNDVLIESILITLGVVCVTSLLAWSIDNY